VAKIEGTQQAALSQIEQTLNKADTKVRAQGATSGGRHCTALAAGSVLLWLWVSANLDSLQNLEYRPQTVDG
jgi:hypothetical protein